MVDSCDIKSSNSHNSVLLLSNCCINLDGMNNICPADGMYAISNCPILRYVYAQNNWWGTTDPNWSNLITYPDSVNYADWSTTEEYPSNVAGAFKRAGSTDISDEFKIARDCEFSGDWETALSMYKSLVSRETRPSVKHELITSILRVNDQHDRNYTELREIINKEIPNAGSWYKAAMDYILGDILLREGKPDEAKSVFLSKVDTYSGTSMEVDMLARVAEIYGDFLGDKVNAKEYADRAASVNPGQDNVRFAYAAAGLEYNPNQFENKFSATDFELISQPLPDDTAIEKNEYVSVSPNPANPITTITYSIKTASDVKLSIYSITGQEVATLVNGPVSAGRHSVTFDGSKYASGVYLYQFQSAGLKKTGKMLLLK